MTEQGNQGIPAGYPPQTYPAQPYPQQPYPPQPYPGYGHHPPVYQAPPRPPVLAEGKEYHLTLTGPGNAWWRPVLALPAVLVGFAVLTLGFTIVMMIGLVVQAGGDLERVFTMDESELLRMDDPWIFGTQNLMLASLIPLAGLTTWLVYQVRPGFLSSVVGRFRWGGRPGARRCSCLCGAPTSSRRASSHRRTPRAAGRRASRTGPSTG